MDFMHNIPSDLKSELNSVPYQASLMLKSAQTMLGYTDKEISKLLHLNLNQWQELITGKNRNDNDYLTELRSVLYLQVKPEYRNGNEPYLDYRQIIKAGKYSGLNKKLLILKSEYDLQRNTLIIEMNKLISEINSSLEIGWVLNLNLNQSKKMIKEMKDGSCDWSIYRLRKAVNRLNGVAMRMRK